MNKILKITLYALSIVLMIVLIPLIKNDYLLTLAYIIIIAVSLFIKYEKKDWIVFLFGFIIWVLLCWPPDFQHLMVGILSAGIVALLTGDLFTRSPHAFTHIQRYCWFIYYIPIFLWECLKANIDVAIRVIHPKTPLKPGIVKLRTTLNSDVALTFLANSITLTPGTLTIDIDKSQKVLYVHWINVEGKDSEAAQRIVRRFEKILKRIFE